MYCKPTWKNNNNNKTHTLYQSFRSYYQRVNQNDRIAIIPMIERNVRIPVRNVDVFTCETTKFVFFRLNFDTCMDWNVLLWIMAQRNIRFHFDLKISTSELWEDTPHTHSLHTTPISKCCINLLCIWSFWIDATVYNINISVCNTPVITMTTT